MINMEEGPLINNNNQILDSKEIKIKSNKEKDFSIIISYNINSLILESKTLERNYYSEINLEELKKNKYFAMFDNLQEIFTEISNIIEKNKLTLIEDINYISLSIPLPTTKIKEFIFKINEKEKSEKEQIKELFNIISELKSNHKKEVLELNKKIDNLNVEINELKKYIKIGFLKDSLIISNSIHANLLKNWINPQKEITSKLLYRLSLNGENMNTLHNLINGKGPTLSIILLKDGIIIGGYTSINWNTTGGWMKDNDAFIFNLTNNSKFNIITNNDTIYFAPNYAIYFGHFGYDEHAKNNMKKLCVHRKGGGGKFLDGDKILSEDYKCLEPKEIEVFHII